MGEVSELVRQHRLELRLVEAPHEGSRHVNAASRRPRVRLDVRLHDELGHGDVGPHAQPLEHDRLGSRRVGVGKVARTIQRAYQQSKAAEQQRARDQEHPHSTSATIATAAAPGRTSASIAVVTVEIRRGRMRMPALPTDSGSAAVTFAR